jgi:hypothetical protein
LIGSYKNAGSDYRPKGCPDEVKSYGGNWVTL